MGQVAGLRCAVEIDTGEASCGVLCFHREKPGMSGFACGYLTSSAGLPMGVLDFCQLG